MLFTPYANFYWVLIVVLAQCWGTQARVIRPCSSVFFSVLQLIRLPALISVSQETVLLGAAPVVFIYVPVSCSKHWQWQTCDPQHIKRINIFNYTSDAWEHAHCETNNTAVHGITSHGFPSHSHPTVYGWNNYSYGGFQMVIFLILLLFLLHLLVDILQ